MSGDAKPIEVNIFNIYEVNNLKYLHKVKRKHTYVPHIYYICIYIDW